MSTRLAVACAVTIAALISTGCGPADKKVDVYPVKGSVTFNGKPVGKAVVVLHPATPTGASNPTATAGSDGVLVFSTYTAGDGAPAGDYSVSIIWPEGSSPIGGDADTGDKLGGRYADPQTSGLKVTVVAGTNELKPFHLK